MLQRHCPLIFEIQCWSHSFKRWVILKINEKQAKKRLQFAKERQNWTYEDWKKVILQMNVPCTSQCLEIKTMIVFGLWTKLNLLRNLSSLTGVQWQLQGYPSSMFCPQNKLYGDCSPSRYARFTILPYGKYSPSRYVLANILSIIGYWKYNICSYNICLIYSMCFVD